ncbi:MAG TPA: RDD family protein [Xanthobacteraceae bacterium]
MTDTQRIGVSGEPKPNAYDPDTQPELFDGVLARRFFAFILDAFIIVVPIIMLTLFIALFGLVTFGIGWLLFFLLTPIFVLWAIVYTGATLGSPQSATIGMRTMGLEMRTWYGSPMYFLLGAVHVIFFWALVTALTPLILLVGLFNRRRRLLHDFLTGTIVINNGTRAAELRRNRGG